MAAVDRILHPFTVVSENHQLFAVQEALSTIESTINRAQLEKRVAQVAFVCFALIAVAAATTFLSPISAVACILFVGESYSHLHRFCAQVAEFIKRCDAQTEIEKDIQTTYTQLIEEGNPRQSIAAFNDQLTFKSNALDITDITDLNLPLIARYMAYADFSDSLQNEHLAALEDAKEKLSTELSTMMSTGANNLAETEQKFSRINASFTDTAQKIQELKTSRLFPSQLSLMVIKALIQDPYSAPDYQELPWPRSSELKDKPTPYAVNRTNPDDPKLISQSELTPTSTNE